MRLGSPEVTGIVHTGFISVSRDLGQTQLELGDELVGSESERAFRVGRHDGRLDTPVLWRNCRDRLVCVPGAEDSNGSCGLGYFLVPPSIMIDS